jgi:hypothetical protein
MNPDSLHSILTFPDTLTILNVGTSSQPLLRPEYLGLVGVFLGAIISTVGGLLLARVQARIQIKNTFFQRRLDVYTKIAEMSWEGYSVINRNVPDEQGDYPQAYDSFKRLRNWLNSMVEVIDKNRFLLDQTTYTKFNQLNWKLLKHIKILKAYKGGKVQDKECRVLGRKSVRDIQQLSEAFVDAARQYIKNTYKLDLEKVL